MDLLGGRVALAVGRAARRRHAIPREPARILLIKLVGMGAVLMAGPLVAAARAAAPAASIELLTGSEHADLFVGSFDRVHAVDRHSAADIARIVRVLRSDPPDLVLDLEAGSRLCAALAGGLGAAAVGLEVPGILKGTYDRSARFRESVHAARNLLRLADVLDWPIPELSPLPVRWSSSADAEAREAIGELGPFAVLNPNASDLAAERRWPSDRWATLGDRLEMPIAVIGGPGDRERTRAVAARVRGALDLGGKLSLPALAALLARARVVVSNDSGPMHLAAAVGAPTVGIFGPETPVLWKPLGSRVATVFAGLPCSPCLSTWDGKIAACHRDRACVAAIGVDDVLAAVHRVAA